MRGPLLPGEVRPVANQANAMGIAAGRLWLELGDRRQVLDFAASLPPGHHLRAQLHGIAELLGG